MNSIGNLLVIKTVAYIERMVWKIIRKVIPSNSKRAKIVRKIRSFFSKCLEQLRLQEILRNRHCATLMRILNAHQDVKGIVIFPPSIEWSATLFQRPQHMALAFAREGYLVFYCQPRYMRSLVAYYPIAPRLYLVSANMECFKNISHPIVVFYPYNREFLPFFTEPYIIYEYIDELEVFSHPSSELQENHYFFLRNADLVITTADSLLEQVREFRPDVLLVPNGVDYTHFQQVWQKQAPPPNDLKQLILSGRPIVGYYGALACWFDYDLLCQVASLRPDINFVLIGPDYDGTVLSAHLDRFPNIYWLGSKDYRELPSYLRYFDVCMIPFVVNNITHSTSPLKLFEFMAAHKPVIVTPMRESLKIEGVLVAETPQAFSRKIDEALRLAHDPEYHKLSDRIALNNTWQVRAQQIIVRADPLATGPKFNLRLQMYVREVGKDMSPEVQNLWETFARTTIQRGNYVATHLSSWVDIQGKSFLDVGCAYGGFLIAFAQKGCSRVVGIDIDANLLELAEINLQEKGIKGELYQLSVEAPEFLQLGMFDLVTCDVIEHVANPEITLQQIARVLKPGGLLYMEIPNPFWYGFLEEDGHYHLPGITLLAPEDARAYFKALYPNTAYGVNEYHLIDWYIKRMNGLGLEVRLLNEHWTEPIAALEEMKHAIERMNRKLKVTRVPNFLAEKISHRAQLLLRYLRRRIDDTSTYDHLRQIFGTDFWIVLGQKRNT